VAVITPSGCLWYSVVQSHPSATELRAKIALYHGLLKLAENPEHQSIMLLLIQQLEQPLAEMEC
jgi:hypothetical protein